MWYFLIILTYYFLYKRIKDKHNEWFDCRSGVRQDDCFSPTIFSLFINDLVSEINNLQIGIDLNGSKLSLVLYADDFCFVANNEADLQAMLDMLHSWYFLISTGMSKAVHFRKGRHEIMHSHLGWSVVIELVETYRYLGVIFHEKSEFNYMWW